MNNSTIYPKRVQLRWRFEGNLNEYIAYHNPYTATISILNPVASEMFKLCDGENSIDDIVQQIESMFDAPSIEVIKNDVENFVSFLEKIGIIIMLSSERN
ncbi:PqqD family protein [Clostridium sp. UBA1652]|uniref:PqqD family protein n=1 Tax=Clostridium sp. UBA1652 TaxID=1946348 RepID=UPI00257EF636|nr:PqqD family protein [Clostridium sp. UBA1652]